MGWSPALSTLCGPPRPSRLVSTDGIEPGRIILPILHAGYVYYPLAVSASATRNPISPSPPGSCPPRACGPRSATSSVVPSWPATRGTTGLRSWTARATLSTSSLWSVVRTNQRHDEYCGHRFANQMRLDVDIVRDTWEECDPGYAIIFHLSLLELVEGGSTWEEVKTLAHALEDAGVAILNTNIGWHEARIRE